MVDPEALGRLQLTEDQVSHVSAQLWPMSSVRDAALVHGVIQ